MYADEFRVTISATGYLDEVSWTLTNAASTVVASGGNYSQGSTNVIPVTGVSGGPYTFFIESQGFFNDNTPFYSVTCLNGGTVYVTGTLTGGQTFTSSSFTGGTVGAAPTIAASGNSLCVNIPVTLTGTPAMGETITEYVWYRNGTIVNYLNANTPNTYGVNSGTVAGSNDYALAVTYASLPGCLTLPAVTTIVTIVPDATVTASGPTTYCADMPTTLSGPAGATTYQWKRSTTILAGATSMTYTPDKSGNHAVTVTDANGCSKTSTWTGIVINPLPVANAGADKVLCAGSSVQIGAASNPAYTYNWSPSTALNSPTLSSPISSATSTITYTVTTTRTSTGCSGTDQVMVNVMAIPATPSIAVSGTGSTRLLTSTTPGASTINWLRNGIAFGQNGKLPNSTLTVPVSNPTKAYSVVSKDANGCLSMPSAASNVRMSDGKGGEVILTENVMQAYPNPTTGLLQVAINNSGVEIAKLVLYNTLGQVVLQKEISLFAGSANVELDMNGFAAGIYSLSFQTENGNYVQKIVKE